MLLDKRGRFLGRFSIIDMLLVLIVLVVAVRFGYARFGARLQQSISEREQVIEVTFIVPAIRDTTVDALRQSKAMFEFKTGGYIGDVVKVTAEPADVLFLSGEGVWSQMKSPNRFDALVTVRGKARMGENVITMGGVEIRVGATVGLKSKWVACNSNVLTINTQVAGD